jgi:uncharacterized protein
MKAFLGLAMAIALLGTSVVQAETQPASDASIHKLLEASQSSKLVDGMMTQMRGIMQQSALGAVGHPLDAQEQQILNRNLDKLADAMRSQMSWSKLEPAITDIYRRNFSQKEIDDLTAFYQSPSGQAMISKMPEVMRESIQMGRDQMSAMIPQMQQISQQMAQEFKEYEATKGKQLTNPTGT